MIAQQAKLEHNPEWMDLQALQRYACMSERTFRDWIHRPLDPLPAVQVDRGKILVRRIDFDRWLEAHPFRGVESIDIGRVVDEVMDDLRKAS